MDTSNHHRIPQPQGLYHPRNEHDACGMGLVASIRGEKSHEIIRKGLEVLINLTHRGAAGCDPETGDGAGILIQIPHAFFVRECGQLGMKLPELGAYGVAMCFLPVEKHSRLQCEGVFERIAQEEGLTLARLARYAGQRRCGWPRSPRLPALYRAALCQQAGRA